MVEKPRFLGWTDFKNLGSGGGFDYLNNTAYNRS